MQQVTTPPEGVTIERVTTAETTPKTAEMLSAPCRLRERPGAGRAVAGSGRDGASASRADLVSVGASANLEVTVNGKPADLSPGTVSVVLPEDATSPANEPAEPAQAGRRGSSVSFRNGASTGLYAARRFGLSTERASRTRGSARPRRDIG